MRWFTAAPSSSTLAATSSTTDGPGEPMEVDFEPEGKIRFSVLTVLMCSIECLCLLPALLILSGEAMDCDEPVDEPVDEPDDPDDPDSRTDCEVLGGANETPGNPGTPGTPGSTEIHSLSVCHYCVCVLMNHHGDDLKTTTPLTWFVPFQGRGPTVRQMMCSLWSSRLILLHLQFLLRILFHHICCLHFHLLAKF